MLLIDEQLCTRGCRCNEDRDHLVVSCDFFGNICYVICGWLEISSASSRNLIKHLTQFCGLGGFSKNTSLVFKMLWLTVVSIIWK